MPRPISTPTRRCIIALILVVLAIQVTGCAGLGARAKAPSSVIQTSGSSGEESPPDRKSRPAGIKKRPVVDFWRQSKLHKLTWRWWSANEEGLEKGREKTFKIAGTVAVVAAFAALWVYDLLPDSDD